MTQCGNNRQRIFFSDDERYRYLNLVVCLKSFVDVRVIVLVLQAKR